MHFLRKFRGRQANTNALRFRVSKAKLAQTTPRTREMLDSGVETSYDAADLRRALAAADPATLLLALVQLTGERHWLETAKPFIRGPMNYQEFMPEPLRQQVRDRLTQVLADVARSGKTPERRTDDALLRE